MGVIVSDLKKLSGELTRIHDLQCDKCSNINNTKLLTCTKCKTEMCIFCGCLNPLCDNMADNLEKDTTNYKH